MCTFKNLIRKVEFLAVKIFKTWTLERFDICEKNYVWKSKQKDFLRYSHFILRDSRIEVNNDLIARKSMKIIRYQKISRNNGNL